MGEFFYGWKRMVGVLTLVMACVFAAGWVRSLMSIQDLLTIPNSKFRSRIGQLIWEGPFKGGNGDVVGRSECGFESFNNRLDLWEFIVTKRQVNWSFCGFGSTAHTRPTFD